MKKRDLSRLLCKKIVSFYQYYRTISCNDMRVFNIIRNGAGKFKILLFPKERWSFERKRFVRRRTFLKREGEMRLVVEMDISTY